ncbi:succinoglycan biosynthesis protein exoi [Ensifer sp. Root127]|uniref:sunset domain-containing protein n=1 Tax=Ensifer sp. Root127 TaxID=1736440 RepID=UPI001FCCEA5F|nr:succinoglycan biosynthesis protein exoi [Ensifer sp. Root127]
MRHQHRRVPQRRRSLLRDAPALLVLVGATGIAGVTSIEEWISDPSKLLSTVDPGCTIKGNVSINTGERIYHVPGQTFYSKTVINSRYGERWFCSEAEARAAGWRKARR